MSVTIELPAEVESCLRREFHDLNQAAKEAMLVELYRQDKLSHHQLGQALSLNRFETEDLLKRYNVTDDFPTVAEYDVALRRLEQQTP